MSTVIESPASEASIALPPDERAQIEREMPTLVTTAQAMLITDAESYERAAVWLRDVVHPRVKWLETAFRPEIKKAFDAHKGLLGLFKRFSDPYAEAEKIVGERMDKYQADARRAEREREEAEQAERERLATMSEEAAAATNAALRQAAEGDILGRAIEATERGDHQQAERILDAPVILPTVIAAPPPIVSTPRTVVYAPPPRIAGVAQTTTYKATVTDMRALVQAWLLGKVPDDLIIVNDARLQKLAGTLQKGMRYPGVRVDEVDGHRISGRR